MELKISKKMMSMLSCGVLGISLGQAAYAQTPQYIGEVCWKVTQQRFVGGDPESFGLRLGTTNVSGSGSHYAFNGYGFDLENNEPGLVVKGTASLTTAGIVVSFDAVGIFLDEEEIDQSQHMSMAYVGTLSSETIGGTVYGREDLITAAEDTEFRLSKGTMTLMACPQL